MSVRLVAIVGALATLSLLLVGCSYFAAQSDVEAVSVESDEDDWIVVNYETGDANLLEMMDAMLDTEVAASEALEDAGAGYIDGNEAGAGAYTLYFAGTDRDEMWSILEPILSEAPLRWSSVELRDGLDDSSPTRIDGTKAAASE